jgi:hypothetical protein
VPPGQGGSHRRGLQSPEIPVDRLIAYVNDQEAGNWLAISYLRPLYKHWLRKDRLLRVDGINAERNGAGVPNAYAPPNATKDQTKGTECSGSVVPGGRISRRFVAQWLRSSLPRRRGHTARCSCEHPLQRRAGDGAVLRDVYVTRQDGNRFTSTGQPFVDFFALAQEAVTKHYADVTNEHVIEDLIDINYGIDEAAPLLKFSTETDKRYGIADLAALAKRVP